MYIIKIHVPCYSECILHTPVENNAYEHTNTPTAFVFGNEVDGVSDEVIQVCDGVIEIPQWGMKHSLNISVAAAVVLWEFVRK